MRQATIRQLQIFAEAARSGAFARVAERLHLTPAAVSAQIRQLESVSGFALFERAGRRIGLTEPGRALLGYAETILQALQDADRALQAHKGLTGGRISVGLVSTAKYIVPHMLARFQATYPAVTLHLHDGNRREIFEALIAGTVDLVIAGRPPAGLPVSGEAFADHPSVIIAAPGHPFVGHEPLHAAMLSGEAFIAREEGSGTRELAERFFQDAGVRPRIVLTSSSNEMLKQAVTAGMGLALISRHTIGLELRLGSLVELPIEGTPLMRAWLISHRLGMPLLPLHARLRSFLIENGREIIVEREQFYAALVDTAAQGDGTRRGERARRLSVPGRSVKAQAGQRLGQAAEKPVDIPAPT